jgi:hypothetical protein
MVLERRRDFCVLKHACNVCTEVPENQRYLDALFYHSIRCLIEPHRVEDELNLARSGTELSGKRARQDTAGLETKLYIHCMHFSIHKNLYDVPAPLGLQWIPLPLAARGEVWLMVVPIKPFLMSLRGRVISALGIAEGASVQNVIVQRQFVVILSREIPSIAVRMEAGSDMLAMLTMPLEPTYHAALPYRAMCTCPLTKWECERDQIFADNCEGKRVVLTRFHPDEYTDSDGVYHPSSLLKQLQIRVL